MTDETMRKSPYKRAVEIVEGMIGRPMTDHEALFFGQGYERGIIDERYRSESRNVGNGAKHG